MRPRVPNRPSPPSGGWGGFGFNRPPFFFHSFFFGPEFFVPVGWYDTAGGYFLDNDNEEESEQPPAPAYQPNDELAREVERLSDEVERLRDEQYERGPSHETANLSPPAPPEKLLPTDFVFRDGHKTEVNNYAIMGKTLYVFEGEATHRIPLAELDLAATEKANAERGVDFVPPSAL